MSFEVATQSVSGLFGICSGKNGDKEVIAYGEKFAYRAAKTAEGLGYELMGEQAAIWPWSH